MIRSVLPVVSILWKGSHMYLLNENNLDYIPLITGLPSSGTLGDKILVSKQNVAPRASLSDLNTPTIQELGYPINWSTLTSRTKKFLFGSKGCPTRLASRKSTLFVGGNESGLEEIAIGMWSTRLLSDPSAIDIVINLANDPFAYSVISSIKDELGLGEHISYLHINEEKNQYNPFGQLISPDPETVDIIFKSIFGDESQVAISFFYNKDAECPEHIKEKISRSKTSGLLQFLDKQGCLGLHLSRFFNPGSTLFCQLARTQDENKEALNDFLSFVKLLSEFPMFKKGNNINVTILGATGNEVLSTSNLSWLLDETFSLLYCDYPEEHKESHPHWLDFAMNHIDQTFLSQVNRKQLPCNFHFVSDMLAELKTNSGMGTPVLAFERNNLLNIPLKLIPPTLPSGNFFKSLRHANGEEVHI